MNDVLRASSVGPCSERVYRSRTSLSLKCSVYLVIASIWREAGRHAAFWHENEFGELTSYVMLDYLYTYSFLG